MSVCRVDRVWVMYVCVQVRQSLGNVCLCAVRQSLGNVCLCAVRQSLGNVCLCAG